jgi:2-polyprenyl-6-methoxyphenol hydroxylase-like FAD-dependent oxidoreductase
MIRADAAVLVVGGGIAGLTAAAALGLRGIAVELVERKPALSDGGGVGLTLVANATRALADIGVAARCVQAGIGADTLAICRPDGTIMMEQPLPRIGGPDWPGATGIRRAALHEILAQAALASGAQVRCGTTVQEWQEDASAIRVSFSDGTTRPYQLVVGADGLYSSMRARLLLHVRPELTGQAVWRAEAPRPASIRRTHIHFGGRHGVVGICPVAEDASYVYIVQSAHDNVRRDEATLHLQMREELSGYGGHVAEIATAIDRADKVSYRPIEWLLAPPPWHRGRLVLIGDAVHANPPVLAQGAAMGIEDAIVLAEEAASNLSDPAAALERFMARRYARVASVVNASCDLARAEVERRHDLDVPGIMGATTKLLAAPI